MLSNHPKWKFYPALCEICQTVREVAPTMCKLWGERFGLKAQQAHARKLSPHPIATRWQSVGLTEAYLLEKNHDGQSPCVLQDAFLQKVASETNKHNKLAKEHEEITADEFKVYTDKMGRWRRDTSATIGDAIFWITINFSLTVRSVSDNLQTWLKGKGSAWRAHG